VGSDLLAVPDVVPLADRMRDRLTVMLPWTGLERRLQTTAGGAQSSGPEALRRASPATVVEAQAAAALHVWAGAVKRAQSVAPANVAYFLRAEASDTPVGPLRFDDAGDALVPSFVPHAWHGSDWLPIRGVAER
jgi:hypothetical protein